MEGVSRVRVTHGVDVGTIRMNYVFLESKRVRPVEFIKEDRKWFLALVTALRRFVS